MRRKTDRSPLIIFSSTPLGPNGEGWTPQKFKTEDCVDFAMHISTHIAALRYLFFTLTRPNALLKSVHTRRNNSQRNCFRTEKLFRRKLEKVKKLVPAAILQVETLPIWFATLFGALKSDRSISLPDFDFLNQNYF